MEVALFSFRCAGCDAVADDLTHDDLVATAEGHAGCVEVAAPYQIEVPRTAVLDREGNDVAHMLRHDHAAAIMLREAAKADGRRMITHYPRAETVRPNVARVIALTVPEEHPRDGRP